MNNLITLRDTIKDRVGDVSSNIGTPTIFKLNPEDEWHFSDDIESIGYFDLDGSYDEITNQLPDQCIIKQVGSKVTEVHNIRVEDNIIPEDIFIFGKNITDFENAFANANVSDIPENLFANCHEAVNFANCFFNCDRISKIPENLFANNRKAEFFSGAFDYCEDLIVIPENLFANNLEAKDFTCTFSRCTYLEDVPDNLFANNTKVESFDGCFSGCPNLKSEPVECVDD